jgi:hypothetical protein
MNRALALPDDPRPVVPFTAASTFEHPRAEPVRMIFKGGIS